MNRLLSFALLLLLSLNVFSQDSLNVQSDETTKKVEQTMSKFNKRESLEVKEKSAKDNQSVKYHIYVLDKATQKPLRADLDITTENGANGKLVGKGKCTAAGEFLLTVAAESELDLYVTLAGYAPQTHKINFSDVDNSMKLNEIKHVFELEKIPLGEYIKLENINFEQGKYELLESSFKELDRLAQQMIDSPTMEIEIAGHTDNTGSTQASLKLSEQRVESVKNYLVSKGINAKRIKGIGYGNSRTLVNDNTEEGHSINRRVEFKILKL